jgi:RND family efflux transporter MFP subunit
MKIDDTQEIRMEEDNRAQHASEKFASEKHASENPEAASPKSQRHGLGFGFIVVILAGMAALGWFIKKGISSRVSAESSLATETRQDAIPAVSVTYPKVSGAVQELVLPGNTQPLSDAPIFARTSGYVKKWYFDIGAHVRQGQVLADIETPEVDQQLQQARADLETANANLSLSTLTAQRYLALIGKGAVAKQDTDDRVGDMNAKKAIVDSAAANVRRLEQLKSFEQVVAPFDGVVTARNTDVGQLVDAGSSNTGKELFHMSATNQLRVFVSVPEEYERSAANGTAATLTLNEFPGRTFRGVLVRNASSIDSTSRTLLAEVDVDNASGELLPGAYVSVHLKLASGSGTALTVPVDTLVFGAEGLRAAVVRDGRAELIPIQTGRDFGDTLEVVSGLRPHDALIVNPPDSLVSGTPVKIVNHAGGD